MSISWSLTPFSIRKLDLFHPTFVQDVKKCNKLSERKFIGEKLLEEKAISKWFLAQFTKRGMERVVDVWLTGSKKLNLVAFDSRLMQYYQNIFIQSRFKLCQQFTQPYHPLFLQTNPREMKFFIRYPLRIFFFSTISSMNQFARWKNVKIATLTHSTARQNTSC